MNNNVEVTLKEKLITIKNTSRSNRFSDVTGNYDVLSNFLANYFCS